MTPNAKILFSNGNLFLFFHFQTVQRKQLHIQRDATPEKSVCRRLFNIMPSSTADKRKSSTQSGISPIAFISAVVRSNSNSALAAFTVLLFVAQIINGQQNGPQQTCPQANEISPCVCQVKKNGLDILCEATDYVHITRAMTALKPKSPIIFYLKLRHNSLPKLQGFIFLALDIRHLTIHNSSLAVIEETSLSSLGEFHAAIFHEKNCLRSMEFTRKFNSCCFFFSILFQCI